MHSGSELRSAVRNSRCEGEGSRAESRGRANTRQTQKRPWLILGGGVAYAARVLQR